MRAEGRRCKTIHQPERVPGGVRKEHEGLRAAVVVGMGVQLERKLAAGDESQAKQLVAHLIVEGGRGTHWHIAEQPAKRNRRGGECSQQMSPCSAAVLDVGSLGQVAAAARRDAAAAHAAVVTTASAAVRRVAKLEQQRSAEAERRRDDGEAAHKALCCDTPGRCGSEQR
jgi:hypothetical protein